MNTLRDQEPDGETGGDQPNCLAGGGEMGALMRATDWAATPLGPVEEWPESLRIAISICLNSRFPILLWWGPQLRLLYNDGYRDIIGDKHPRALGQPGSECWAEIWDVIGPMAEQVVTTGIGTWSDDLCLFLYRHGYKEECYFTFSFSPIRDESGQIVGMFTPVQETTARVKAARRLRSPQIPLERNSVRESTVESAVTAMAAIAENPADIPFAILYCIDAAQTSATLVGVAGIEAGAPAAPYTIPFDAPPSVPWLIREAVESGVRQPITNVDGEAWRLPLGAWEAPAHTVMAIPLMPRGGVVTGVLVCALSPHSLLDTEYGAFLDRVTDQMTATLADAMAREEEQRLLRSLEAERARLAGLFEQAPAFLAVLRGPDHVYESANAPYLQLVGRSHIVGRRVSEVLPEIVEQGFLDVLDEVYASGQAYHARETPVRLQRNEGAPMEELFLTLVFQPLLEEDGSTSGIFVLGVDSTESVRARQQLMAKGEALAAADRAKDEFLAMLGHELRNPLGGISNALYLVKARTQDRADLQNALRSLTRQTEHLSRLVDDLLDVSRITRNKINLQQRPVALGPLLASVVASIRPAATAKRLTMTLEAAADPWVIGDPLRLDQIVTNLLTNAIKYTEAGTIRATLDVDDEFAVLTVSDTGIGIAGDVLPRVFDLFTQADSTLDRAHGGLGIGLTLARRLTELHGGAMEASSDGLGCGSTFTVRLPRTAPGPSEEARAEAPTQDASRARVLVVDDNADAAEMLAEVFTTWGYTADVAFDGTTALARAEATVPDVILLDIGLPGMDGYEVATKLRGMPGLQSVPIIALTGYGQPDDRRRAEDAGFNHHLTKPVNLETLRSLLAGVRPPQPEPGN